MYQEEFAFAQHAHFRQALLLPLEDRRVRLSDDVLMLDGDNRHVQANHRAGLAGKIAGARHDVFGNDVALVGLDQPFAV